MSSPTITSYVVHINSSQRFLAIGKPSTLIAQIFDRRIDSNTNLPFDPFKDVEPTLRREISRMTTGSFRKNRDTFVLSFASTFLHDYVSGKILGICSALGYDVTIAAIASDRDGGLSQVLAWEGVHEPDGFCLYARQLRSSSSLLTLKTPDGAVTALSNPDGLLSILPLDRRTPLLISQQKQLVFGAAYNRTAKIMSTAF